MKKYNPKSIEKKWQKTWEKKGVYRTEVMSSKPKFYILDMFPYPSGEALHVGHPKGYIASDVVSRFKRMKGFNVLHPMGWDAFGLPAENYAIKHKVNPNIATKKNVAKFKKQLFLIGLDYDWKREINTTDPNYYKWTQWIFLQLFKKGLAYESNEPINWCPSCKTGLANEDLENGKCERCESEVEKKPMRQWVLKITAYADRLLKDLDLLDWPEFVKVMQKNWIGRSEGANVDFRLFNISGQEDGKHKVTVFTTRPDTLFGATFLAISAELAKNWIDVGWQAPEEVKKFVEKILTDEAKRSYGEPAEKEGIFTGITAENPVNKERIPVWIANYVLSGYGTGAIMAVPAHDERDQDFAQLHHLKFQHVIDPEDDYNLNDYHPSAAYKIKEGDLDPQKTSFLHDYQQVRNGEQRTFSYSGSGKLINSDFFDGLSTQDAKIKIIEWLEKNNVGKKSVTYKLRDWVFSRQRYWGEPIPIVHCKKCGAVAVPESELPLKLPNVRSYEPMGTGESPLANIKKWVNTKCPNCGGRAKRETNTMPQWAGSSWYYLRYIDPHNDKALIDPEKEKQWIPVDIYVGGDHATRHLIYARFWHKFLFDIGVAYNPEPFKRLEYLGMILAEDGRKMSKRWGNVINPDDIIVQYGADSLRLYEMFMGPFEGSVAWNTESMIGARRFLERVWKMTLLQVNKKIKEEKRHRERSGSERGDLNTVEARNEIDNVRASTMTSRGMRPLVHQTIKKVTDDIENFKFNTCVSRLMVLLNDFDQVTPNKEELEAMLKLLSPFAPHVTEELWHALGHETFIVNELWPTYDESKLSDETVTIAVQFNGKMRGTVVAVTGSKEDDVKETVMGDEKLKKYFIGESKKIIFVPDKIINFVV